MRVLKQGLATATAAAVAAVAVAAAAAASAAAAAAAADAAAAAAEMGDVFMKQIILTHVVKRNNDESIVSENDTQKNALVVCVKSLMIRRPGCGS